MNEKTRQSLIDALVHCHLSELPEVWDGGSVWIKALARVIKKNGEETFALAKRVDGGEYRLIKDFGSSATIYKVKEYYPFMYLEQAYMPAVHTKEECLVILGQYGVNTANLQNKEYDELIITVVDYAVKKQLEDDSYNKKYYSIELDAKESEEYNNEEETITKKSKEYGKKRRIKKED